MKKKKEKYSASSRQSKSIYISLTFWFDCVDVQSIIFSNTHFGIIPLCTALHQTTLIFLNHCTFFRCTMLIIAVTSTPALAIILDTEVLVVLSFRKFCTFTGEPARSNKRRSLLFKDKDNGGIYIPSDSWASKVILFHLGRL